MIKTSSLNELHTISFVVTSKLYCTATDY